MYRNQLDNLSARIEGLIANLDRNWNEGHSAIEEEEACLKRLAKKGDTEGVLQVQVNIRQLELRGRARQDNLVAELEEKRREWRKLNRLQMKYIEALSKGEGFGYNPFACLKG